MLSHRHTLLRETNPATWDRGIWRFGTGVLRVLKNVTVWAVSWGVWLLKSGEICVKQYNGNRRPSLESLSPLKGVRGEVCNLKRQWRGHLFVTKPDVTAAYTSNRRADWRIVMYTAITHTHSANSHTLNTQWHAPCLCTWAHKQQQCRVNRVQFLWLPSSNNSCSITGPTSQTVPRERADKSETEQTDRGAGFRKADNKTHSATEEWEILLQTEMCKVCFQEIK